MSEKRTEQQIFACHLESVNNKLASYTAEVTKDKLIIRSMNKGKVKLELDIQTIAPSIGFETVLVSDEANFQK